jgi:hypothetical protein
MIKHKGIRRTTEFSISAEGSQKSHLRDTLNAYMTDRVDGSINSSAPTSHRYKLVRCLPRAAYQVRWPIQS